MRFVTGLVIAWTIGCTAIPLARGLAGARPGYVSIGEGLSSSAPGAEIEFA